MLYEDKFQNNHLFLAAAQRVFICKNTLHAWAHLEILKQ